MNNQERSTLPRAAKGPMAPPPVLEGTLKVVADAVSDWPGIQSTVHWTLDHRDVDGIDFYLGDDELGHLHLDGSIHLATSAGLGAAMVLEGVAQPFRYQRGWVEERLGRIGAAAAIGLFRRNYEALIA